MKHKTQAHLSANGWFKLRDSTITRSYELILGRMSGPSRMVVISLQKYWYWHLVVAILLNPSLNRHCVGLKDRFQLNLEVSNLNFPASKVFQSISCLFHHGLPRVAFGRSGRRSPAYTSRPSYVTVMSRCRLDKAYRLKRLTSTIWAGFKVLWYGGAIWFW